MFLLLNLKWGERKHPSTCAVDDKGISDALGNVLEILYRELENSRMPTASRMSQGETPWKVVKCNLTCKMRNGDELHDAAEIVNLKTLEEAHLLG